MSCSCRSWDRVWCRSASWRGVSPSLSGMFRLQPSLTNNYTTESSIIYFKEFLWFLCHIIFQCKKETMEILLSFFSECIWKLMFTVSTLYCAEVHILTVDIIYLCSSAPFVTLRVCCVWVEVHSNILDLLKYIQLIQNIVCAVFIYYHLPYVLHSHKKSTFQVKDLCRSEILDLGRWQALYTWS